MTTQRYQLFINNQWEDPASNEWFDALDPFSGEAFAQIPRGGPGDVDRAVRAAKAALEGPWGRMSATNRGAMLENLARAIEARCDQLSAVEARDNGKLLTEVRGQVGYVAKYFRYYGGLADKIQGAVVPIDKPSVFNYVKYEPIGVVATITPWNSSLLLSAWKLAPALCAGNTIVAKPSEHTSASLFELARLFVEVGFPPGVFNVATGFADGVGEPLATHPDVSMVAFTGGEAGGRGDVVVVPLPVNRGEGGE